MAILHYRATIFFRDVPFQTKLLHLRETVFGEKVAFQENSHPISVIFVFKKYFSNKVFALLVIFINTWSRIHGMLGFPNKKN